MERVEAALKSSIRKEMAFKTTLNPVYEDFVTVTTTADDFSVDDFFDLSKDDVFTEEEEAEQQQQQQEMLHVSSEEPQDNGDALRQSNNDGFGFGSLPTSELSVPADELAELEWLSHFVEDSFTTPNLTRTPTDKPAWLTGDRKHPLTPTVTQGSSFKSPLVPSKSRTKRNRNGTNFWSVNSSTSSSSYSTSSSSSSSALSNTCLSGAELLEPLFTSEKPPVPKKHKKRSPESVFSGQLLLEHQQPSRRCTHCGVQKTPQWRAGPMGAKTLCNACGVRYKSGRLLPEYRPACSPTFSSELHSNHHRKVIEMRRKKEPADDNDTGLNQLVQSSQAVPSF